MTLDTLKQVIKKHAKKSQTLIWQKSAYIYSPFISQFGTVSTQAYNTAYMSTYSLATLPDKKYTLLLSFHDGEYFIKCGDAYVEGNISTKTVDSLLRSSLGKLKNNRNKNLPKLLKSSFNTVPKSQTCNLNQKNYRAVGEAEVCTHIANFLNDLPKDVFDTLYANYYQALNEATTTQISAELEEKFERYAFKKHILLEGDKGSGKTYAAAMWGKEKMFTQIFIGGHEQFESIDFLGHYIQQKSGELIWKDGPLSEAFRKANSGEEIVLIIDEILRIPKRELNLLISALSPIDSKYVLRTGRAMSTKDDIAIEEVIQAPTKNLWVIGTTNIGAAYAVEAMDEALVDRFKPIRKDTSAEELRRILMQSATKRRFSQESVSILMDFYSKMSRLYQTKIITKLVNIRHLNEAIELARNEGEVREILKDSTLLWVERDYDGYPNKEQIHAVEIALGKAYG